MSVENKIKALLDRAGGKQSLTEESKENLAAAGIADTGAKAASSMSKDTSKSGVAANAGDKTQPKQGSSKDASFTSHDEDDSNPGAKAAAGITKAGLPDKKGDAKSVKVPSMEETDRGEAKNIREYFEKEHIGSTKSYHVHSTDPESASYTITHKQTGKKHVVNVNDHWPENTHSKIHADVKKEVPKEAQGESSHIAKLITKHISDAQDEVKEETIDVSAELNSIFGEELSEEFKTKATSIFEAAVIARVNSEMEKVTTMLEERSEQQLVEFKETLVEKVDNYLNYVVEQWMEENQLAVESGLRTEIAEDFIDGLRSLFKEHYIEVPDEKLDVLENLQTTAEELQSKLDEEIEKNISAVRELDELKAAKIFEEQTKDLVDTEVEKLRKLVEGVGFENEDLYREKLAVIKENYFPKTAKTSTEKVLVEENDIGQPVFTADTNMSRYVQALTRTIKSR